MRTIESCIKELRKENDTSMNVWLNYWMARCILREIALNSYNSVIKNYPVKNLDFPTEGFKDIADDCTENMRDIYES